MEEKSNLLDLTEYFLQAVKNDDLKAVKHFVNTQSVDFSVLNSSRITGLMQAILNNNLEMVNFLIESGVDIEARSGSITGFGLGNINSFSEYTALMIASGTAGSKEGVEVLKAVLAAGADIEARASGGQTAIMLTSYVPALEALIDARANVNAADAGGFTLLMRLAWTGQTEAVPLLINSGVDSSAKDEQGWTAMRHAKYEGDYMAKSFEEAGIAAA